MYLADVRWSVVLAVFLVFQIGLSLGANGNYEASLPYRQEVLDATDLPCGSEREVKLGEKYLFDSRSSILYESATLQANYGSRKRSPKDPTNVKMGSSNFRQPEKQKDVGNVNTKIGNTGLNNNNNNNNNKLADSRKSSPGRNDKSSEVSERAYGGSGGGGYSQGKGGYGGGQSSSGYGGSSYGGGLSYGSSGSYGPPTTYSSQPAVCQWTYFASSNCTLETHIVRFKPGDMDCYKQQFVISDNHTEFKMCGYETLYPAFRAETPIIYIKYWKLPYTYRHVFKGYVTCAGRAQRPAFNETYYDNKYPSVAYPQAYYYNKTAGNYSGYYPSPSAAPTYYNYNHTYHNYSNSTAEPPYSSSYNSSEDPSASHSTHYPTSYSTHYPTSYSTYHSTSYSTYHSTSYSTHSPTSHSTQPPLSASHSTQDPYSSSYPSSYPSTEYSTYSTYPTTYYTTSRPAPSVAQVHNIQHAAPQPQHDIQQQNSHPQMSKSDQAVMQETKFIAQSMLASIQDVEMSTSFEEEIKHVQELEKEVSIMEEMLETAEAAAHKQQESQAIQSAQSNQQAQVVQTIQVGQPQSSVHQTVNHQPAPVVISNVNQVQVVGQQQQQHQIVQQQQPSANTNDKGTSSFQLSQLSQEQMLQIMQFLQAQQAQQKQVQQQQQEAVSSEVQAVVQTQSQNDVSTQQQETHTHMAAATSRLHPPYAQSQLYSNPSSTTNYQQYQQQSASSIYSPNVYGRSSEQMEKETQDKALGRSHEEEDYKPYTRGGVSHIYQRRQEPAPAQSQQPQVSYAYPTKTIPATVINTYPYTSSVVQQSSPGLPPSPSGYPTVKYLVSYPYSPTYSSSGAYAQQPQQQAPGMPVVYPS